MDYEAILEDIRPSNDEKNQIINLSSSLIDFLNKTANENSINAEAVLVGSTAKKTWLAGKSDIDIFIHFPLDTPVTDLKKNGLFLGHKCIEKMNGIAEEKYASHPYVTGSINGFDIDFVPCYKIKDSTELKSAVDRTILHTQYINQNLKKSQIDEVLLLKKFMEGIETYGSDFRVGGFAGYLCELMILKYDNFLNTLRNVSKYWKEGFGFDIEGHGNLEKFDEPLTVIDPTDKNRNVAASLTLLKLSEFIAASHNFLNNPKTEYFYKLERKIAKEEILNKFNERNSSVIFLSFDIPDITEDSLYPQLKKTEHSIVEKLIEEDFKVIKSDVVDVNKKHALMIFELFNARYPKYKTHYGPKVYFAESFNRFLDKYGEDCYILNDSIVVDIERKFKNEYEFIDFLLQKENINNIRIGKNLKKKFLEKHEILDFKTAFDSLDYLKNIEDNNELMEFFYDYLIPSKVIFR